MMKIQRSEADALIDELGLPKAGGRLGVAAVLFTYRCTIACRHCLFGCSPDRPDRVMTPRQCADALAMLLDTGRVVHVAGGEPMLYWDELAEALRLACAEGNAPHFVETNCSFATDDDIARQRLEFLAAHGVRGLLASADPFHQEFVPADRFLRVRRWARRIFGERMFWGTEADDAAVAGFEAAAKDGQRLAEHVRGNPPVMVGAAGRELAPYLDSFAPGDARLPKPSWRAGSDGPGCLDEFRSETLWEFHVDPYGNILTNCGIILARVNETTPSALLEAGPERANRYVRVLCDEGPAGLAALARREYGFTLPERVTQSCDLCWRTRRFLRRFHPGIFGPAEIYED